MNGVNSLRYIDSILNDWNKKGYKSREDVLKDRENYRKKKKNVDQIIHCPSWDTLRTSRAINNTLE